MTFKEASKTKRDFIVNSNAIIAKFMGIDKYQSLYSTLIQAGRGDLSEYIFNIGFQKSWDSLMPVIDKIENFKNHSVKIERCNNPKIKFICKIKYSNKVIIQESKKSKIEASYVAIIKFVKAYNKKIK